MLGAILSVAGSAIGALSSKSASDQAAKGAEQAADIQRELGNRSLDLQEDQWRQSQEWTRPFWESGVNDLAVRNYLMGTGARPTVGGSSSYGQRQTAPITEVRSSGGGSGGARSLSDLNRSTARSGGDPFNALSFVLGNLSGKGSTYKGSSSGGSTYRVGDQVFETLEDAQRYAERTAQPRSGGGGTPYEGYAPYKETFDGLNSEYEQGVADLYNQKNFFKSPDYQFVRDEGMDAIAKAAGARGLALSGAALKDSARFASGQASGEWQNYLTRGMALNDNRYGRQAGQYLDYMDRLSGGAATGQGAATAMTSAGQANANASGNILSNMAAGIGSAYTSAADARAGGIMGMNNSIQGGIENLMFNNMMRQPAASASSYAPTTSVRSYSNPFY